MSNFIPRNRLRACQEKYIFSFMYNTHGVDSDDCEWQHFCMNSSNCHRRSLQQAREWFDIHGISVTEWAQSRGFERATVYAVLSGRTRGRRGQAHAIAVALGLKPAPEGPSPLASEEPNVDTTKVAGIAEGKDTTMPP